MLQQPAVTGKSTQQLAANIRECARCPRGSGCARGTQWLTGSTALQIAPYNCSTREDTMMAAMAVGSGVYEKLSNLGVVGPDVKQHWIVDCAQSALCGKHKFTCCSRPKEGAHYFTRHHCTGFTAALG